MKEKKKKNKIVKKIEEKIKNEKLKKNIKIPFSFKSNKNKTERKSK